MRGHLCAKENGLRAIVGSEVTMEDGSVVPLLVASQTGYRNLCRLLTAAKLRSEKGQCSARWDELPQYAEGLFALTGDEEGPVRRAWRAGGHYCCRGGSPARPFRSLSQPPLRRTPAPPSA